MKKLLSLMFLVIMLVNLHAEYIISNSDEENIDKKYYGYQLEQSNAWKGYKISIDTTTKISEYSYVQGISTTTYSDWWNVRRSTTTNYYDGFSYKRHIYGE